ncbi:MULTISPECIES: Gfo/Idh/MocA family protein [Bacillus]|uniref:Gfo/Idh/MocA-like oxidoreductase N-terminal domain-containing protein n=2 Tax=Bacillus TaxID=1386 RepID=A0A0M4GAN9_9BACI|nr:MULTISPECIES: Gfo/Idh/MocA family oxidoreductase [Bacillus]ALC82633.1 hypothetical protein AM592_14400 [Bacillus gobiensis]MBP1081573.1 putative dehydrogenase [Bacillus capparidis]MED1096234.1 Gfo/Idh/MocA family oxidoreductase [Bacillus capparidis]
MKVGILGTGFGSYHADIYRKTENVDSVIIFGRNEEKLKKLEQDLQITATNNIDNIMTNKEIDLIDVCLPSTLHKKYVIDALKNGKNVYCETPVALTLEDAIAMKQAADKYGRKVFVDQFIKFEQPYQYIYSLAQQNTYGKLKALHLKRKTPPLWGDLGLNHITTNFMIHEIDFVTWLIGSPKQMTAAGLNGKAGTSHVDALFHYDDTVVEVQCSSMMPGYHPFTVAYEAVFEDATVEYVENGHKDRSEMSLKLFTNDGQEEVKVENSDCYAEAIKHVLECCEKDIPTSLSIDDAIPSLEIAIEIKEMLISTNT